MFLELRDTIKISGKDYKVCKNNNNNNIKNIIKFGCKSSKVFNNINNLIKLNTKDKVNNKQIYNDKKIINRNYRKFTNNPTDKGNIQSSIGKK